MGKADKNETPATIVTEDRGSSSGFLALAIIAVIVGIAVVAAFAINGGQGDGGLFGEGKMYEEATYNFTMENTGNAPFLGTIGTPWEETITGLDRAVMITFEFTKDVGTAFTYTLEQEVDGEWQTLQTATVGANEHSMVISGEFAGETIRFRAEPSSGFVQEAQLGVLVIQES